MEHAGQRFKTTGAFNKGMKSEGRVVRLDEKYISTSDKAKDQQSKKVVISDEAYAICELLEEVKNTFNAMRFNK